MFLFAFGGMVVGCSSQPAALAGRIPKPSTPTAGQHVRASTDSLVGRWESWSFVSTNVLGSHGNTPPLAVDVLEGATNLVFRCYRVGNWTTNTDTKRPDASIEGELFVTHHGKDSPVREGRAWLLTDDGILFGTTGDGFLLRYSLGADSLTLEKQIKDLAGRRDALRRYL